MPPDIIIFPASAETREETRRSRWLRAIERRRGHGGMRLLEEIDASTPEGKAVFDGRGHGGPDMAPDHLVEWRMYLPRARCPLVVRAVRSVLRSVRPRTRRPRARRRSTRASRAGPDPGGDDPAGKPPHASREYTGDLARPPPRSCIFAHSRNYEGVRKCLKKRSRALRRLI